MIVHFLKSYNVPEIKNITSKFNSESGESILKGVIKEPISTTFKEPPRSGHLGGSAS